MKNNKLYLISDYIKSNSNLDTHRPYVGMSSIADCPLALYNNFQNGIIPTHEGYQRSYQGYMYEREVKKILLATGLYQSDTDKELVAPFDSRFRGHIDGEDTFGNLIEIKSMSAVKFNKIKETGKLPYKIYAQVQAYLKYGNYTSATVYMVNTELFEFNVMSVGHNENAQKSLEQKAKGVLNAIDTSTSPSCTCGRCYANQTKAA
jgi:hypothetical protein